MRSRDEKILELISNLIVKQRQLNDALEELNGHWAYEDLMYRFYHQSFKTYHMQNYTEQIVELLQGLCPKDCKFHDGYFSEVIQNGTGKAFKLNYNSNWLKHVAPISLAFLHTKYFLEMAVKYGKELEHCKTIKDVPHILPSGWAAFLYLYGLR